jgi:hypothetical protein
MELELFIEAYISLDKPLTISSKQQTIQQFARLWGRPEVRDYTRVAATVPDSATQVTRLIPSELIIDKCPRRLPCNTPCIPRKADDVKSVYPFSQPLPPPIVAKMDIVMDENQDRRVFLGLFDGTVIKGRKPFFVLGKQHQLHRVGVLVNLQGSPQCRLCREILS